VEQRAIAGTLAKSRVDTVLDQPRQGDAGEIGGNQRNDAENKKPAMAIDQKPDAVVMTKNLFTLLLRLAALVLAPRANRGSSEYRNSRQDAKNAKL
jgi:hypothetical protein